MWTGARSVSSVIGAALLMSCVLGNDPARAELPACPAGKTCKPVKWTPYCYSWGYIASKVPDSFCNQVDPALSGNFYGYGTEDGSDAFTIASFQRHWDLYHAQYPPPYTLQNLGPWVPDPASENIPDEWSLRSYKAAELYDGKGRPLIGNPKFRYRMPTCSADWNLQSIANSDGTGNFSRFVCSQPRVISDACVGNPVEVSAGEKFDVETLISQTDLPLSMTYSSRAIAFYGGTPQDGAFGANRTHDYEKRVQSTASGQVWVYRTARDVRYFVLSGGNWIARDPDIKDRLVEKTSSGARVGWTYVDAANEASEEYDASGRLLAIKLRDGRSTDLTYDSQGRLVRVTNQFGRALVFDYAGSDTRIAGVTDTKQHRIQLTYDSSGRLSMISFPGGGQKAYLYNEPAYTSGANLPNALTGIVDELGFRYATYSYDVSGRVAATAHNADPATRVDEFRFAWPNSSYYERTVVTDPLGTTRTYEFRKNGGAQRPTALSQPCPSQGSGSSFKSRAYDANGNIASWTNFNDKKACYWYDLTRNLETGRVEGLWSYEGCTLSPPNRPDIRKVTTTWHPSFRLPLIITEPAAGGSGTKTTTLAYDANGNMTQKSVTGPRNDGTTGTVARTWRWTYGTLGRVLTATDPNGNVTTTTYWPDSDPDLGKRGNVATITNPLGHVTQIVAYDANGRPLSIVDPNGAITTLAYHPRGWLTSRTAAGEATTYDYDAVGQLIKATQPDGSYLAYTYDGAHRLTGIRDGLGNSIAYTLDAMGNRQREDVYDPSGALARTRSHTFDSLNRLAADIGALSQSTRYSYDGQGNRLASTDPLARITATGYDALNRILTVTDPASRATRYAYDAAGNLASVTDPRNLTTSYTYDGLGNATKLVSPDTWVATSTFDAAGNLQTRLDALGVTTTYSYDALNRVARIVYSKTGATSETHDFEYDGGSSGAPNAKGRLTRLVDTAGTTTWTYDPHGRVTTATQTVGTAKTIRYAYNAAGQLATLTTPSGQVLGYSYVNGRVTSIMVNGGPLITAAQTSPFGPLRAWQWGNGLYTFRDYDADGRLTTWEFRNGTSILRNDLTWDLANRITALVDPAAVSLGCTFQYDSLDRLAVARNGNPVASTQQFGYDAVGNRLNFTKDGAVTNYGYAASSNQLLNLTGATARTYVYDAAGNPTMIGSLGYVYNNANRLVNVKNGTATVASYKVNALGQRVQKVAGGSTTRFVYDEQGRLIGEYDGNGKLIQETVWLEDLPVATLRPTGATGTPTPIDVYYVHADHLGTPRAVSRPSDNAIVWRWDNVDPFGNNPADENPSGLGIFKYSLRFPGQYYDVETGTHYNYFRDYDPSVGRYEQSDPIGLMAGVNT